MRVRKRRGVEDYIAKNPQFVVENPIDFRGCWAEHFDNDHPICIDVGCGKGQFITNMAKLNPNINYIGIDLQLSVLSHVLDKILEENLTNVQLLHVDGRNLLEYFSEGEVSIIYLNFSDPWPKSRHEKRRLTYDSFLKTYEKLLIPEGEIHFKTDNRGLFEYSLTSFSRYGMFLKQVWLDLHKSDFKENVLTEYEEKFSNLGQIIYRVEAKFKKI
ncbi:MAG: tRNA (guanosine(46)-N7)-methyltransferase TrmB [Lactobacillales bacterium]|jgi:tRNA (guanine-N7-)-methyltransferase|nr:tRNA (guanosine(46)-N7)-methyltransferase TrmB [Lactobacillales bacterium]